MAVSFDVTVWLDIVNFVDLNLQLTEKPPGASGALFAIGSIYRHGEVVPVGKVMPILVIRVLDQDSTDLETTGKQAHFLPVSLKCYFDKDSANPATAGDIFRVHSDVFSVIYQQMMLARTVAGKAIDTFYRGGGTLLTPEDIEGDPSVPSRFSFEQNWEIHYRHTDVDPTDQV